ncbi:hypothetical protein SAMD00023353_0101670 [Rosellinia necatrix]|uniref:Uncharacterized protein n=1 Tax=Rosellinia necatrix TaxID=77044 RepID=A0A1S7UIB6_ROSNE|nr:hypothetical protein SAMD00023353_0101670 [Rosellinia necatrix]
MSFGKALQSVAFYLVSCTPCHQAQHKRRLKKVAREQRRARQRRFRETGLEDYHIEAFATNPYWATEIDAGPHYEKYPKKTKPPDKRPTTGTGHDTDTEPAGGPSNTNTTKKKPIRNTTTTDPTTANAPATIDHDVITKPAKSASSNAIKKKKSSNGITTTPPPIPPIPSISPIDTNIITAIDTTITTTPTDTTATTTPTDATAITPTDTAATTPTDVTRAPFIAICNVPGIDNVPDIYSRDNITIPRAYGRDNTTNTTNPTNPTDAETATAPDTGTKPAHVSFSKPKKPSKFKTRTPVSKTVCIAPGSRVALEPPPPPPKIRIPRPLSTSSRREKLPNLFPRVTPKMPIEDEYDMPIVRPPSVKPNIAWMVQPPPPARLMDRKASASCESLVSWTTSVISDSSKATTPGRQERNRMVSKICAKVMDPYATTSSGNSLSTDPYATYSSGNSLMAPSTLSPFVSPPMSRPASPPGDDDSTPAPVTLQEMV